MEPLLKWVGSKRWHAGEVAKLVRLEEALVEPFAGSAAITFAAEPRKAILNDANPHLINFYRWVQAGLEITIDDNPVLYFDYRRWFNDLITNPQTAMSAQAAELFYYLNHRAFNNLWRVNSNGLFNVPPRPTMRGPLPPLGELSHNWLVTNRDYKAFLENIIGNGAAFIYADPPYDDGFTGYIAGKFSWDEQMDLAMRLSIHPGPVILMNKATDRIVRAYQALGFTTTLLDAPQRMHHSQGGIATVREVMATNSVVDWRIIQGQ